MLKQSLNVSDVLFVFYFNCAGTVSHALGVWYRSNFCRSCGLRLLSQLQNIASL